MTPRQLKLERVRKYLADIPVKAHPSDLRISVLVAIAQLTRIIREDEQALPERPFSVQLADEQAAWRSYQGLEDVS